jgi:D-alanyl-D-alanine carboxypeptidase
LKKFLNICYLILFSLVLGACASGKKLDKTISTTLSLESFRNHFTGILIYDPISGDTLYQLNSDKYFTPASNTKIFTLYTSLLLLPKQIPALKYCNVNDTLFIEGTGDPSLLHPYLKDSSVTRFLKDFKNISLNQNNITDSKFGPGWAWEDYDGYYSAERSALPVYGNVVTISNPDTLRVIPNYFNSNVNQIKNTVNREIDTNTFYFDPSRKDTLEIPFIADGNIVKVLLEAQPPRWVDGSGLSRYNLFSPEAIVYVLNAIYRDVPKERLFNLFAEGGESGTIADWYPGNPYPYIYAKTGTLGNNHNISGYLITKSGKTLIFSFMNNHFTNPSSDIKKQMQYVFEWVRDNY